MVQPCRRAHPKCAAWHRLVRTDDHARMAAKADGSGYDLPPTLTPLAPVKDRLIVLRHANKEADPLAGEAGRPFASQAVSSRAFIQEDGRFRPRAGISDDQIVARELGKQTSSRPDWVEAVASLAAVRRGYAWPTAARWRGAANQATSIRPSPAPVFERFRSRTHDRANRRTGQHGTQHPRHGDRPVNSSEATRPEIARGEEYFESVRTSNADPESQEQRTGDARIDNPGGVPE